MENTIKKNSAYLLKKSFVVSLYILIFSFFIPVFFGALGIFLDQAFNPISSLPFPFESLGGALLLTGFGFIAGAIFYLGKTGRGLPISPVPPVNLVVRGPYKYSRHPIYFGASLAFLGTGLLLHSFWCIFLGWPLFTLFFLIYANRVEEPVLEERYGNEYLLYKQSVPIFCEFPFRKLSNSFAIHVMNFLSKIVNKPIILEYRSFRLFLGYGLWAGLGTFVGLIFLSMFLSVANIAVSSILWMAVIFVTTLLAFSRLVSMLTLIHLEKVSFKAAWFRVGFISWGGLAAAGLCVVPYSLMTGASLYFWFDAVFTGLMITHFFGRIGCLFYGCCYGKETKSLIHIKYEHACLKAVREKKITHGLLYPTQLFSAFFSLTIFLLVTSIWGLKGIGVGIPTSLCLILYGTFRFLEEWFRYQKKKLAGIFSPAQIICFLLVVLGIIHLGWISPNSLGAYPPLAGLSWGQFFDWNSFIIFGGLFVLATFVFSYHRYEIGRWGKENTTEPPKKSMGLHYENKYLHCQSWTLADLAEKFGTPLYVISKQAAQAAIKEFLSSFETLGIPVKLHYSVKTNPVPGFIQIIKDEGLSVEIISEHELILCKKLGFQWEDIVINGPAKSLSFLKKTKNTSVKMVTIESLSDLERLKNVVADADKPLNVGVRICPSFFWGKLKPTLNSGAKNSPYGFPAYSSELKTVLTHIKQNGKLFFIGFHMHLGSGIKDSRPYEKAFSVLEKVIKKAHGIGLKCHAIDIGGGFGLSTAPILNASQLMRSSFLKKNMKYPVSLNGTLLNDVVKHLDVLLKRLRNSGIHIKEILVEPGRIISGPSELLILSVLDVIEQPGKHNYLICDSGALSLSPLLFAEYHRIIPLDQKNGPVRNYTVLGNMPSSMDKLSSATTLPCLENGDRIALLDTGAYFVSMNNNFAGPRPAIVLIDGNKASLARRRETIEEMYQRDYF